MKYKIQNLLFSVLFFFSNLVITKLLSLEIKRHSSPQFLSILFDILLNIFVDFIIAVIWIFSCSSLDFQFFHHSFPDSFGLFRMIGTTFMTFFLMIQFSDKVQVILQFFFLFSVDFNLWFIWLQTSTIGQTFFFTLTNFDLLLRIAWFV